jgi:hypothetical protein
VDAPVPLHAVAGSAMTAMAITAATGRPHPRSGPGAVMPFIA